MRVASRLSIMAVASLLAAGCGGGGDEAPSDEERSGSAAPTETTTPAEPGATTNAAPPATTAQGRKGRQLVAQSGCFACHTIGGSGNDGPGPELTDVGERMPASAIARVLVDPTPPMPSFAGLPAQDRAAIVAYLSSLR